MIELFSTFFDRLSSHNPQRESMLKQLYQFKALLYANDLAVEKFLHDLQANKSPLKRDNSQTKKSSSIKPRAKHHSALAPCGHEIDADSDSRLCPTCNISVLSVRLPPTRISPSRSSSRSRSRSSERWRNSTTRTSSRRSRSSR